MKKVTTFAVIFLLIFSGFSILLTSAHAQTVNIASETVAQEIAANAGGTYVQGAAAPALTGTQVALPVVDQATGQILGHIVAEQASLVSSLSAAGFTEVATAMAAVEAGTVAGAATTTGLALGTTGTAVAVGAGVAGVALAVSGGDSSTTTTHHH